MMAVSFASEHSHVYPVLVHNLRKKLLSSFLCLLARTISQTRIFALESSQHGTRERHEPKHDRGTELLRSHCS